jgi:hypothetical protein
MDWVAPVRFYVLQLNIGVARIAKKVRGLPRAQGLGSVSDHQLVFVFCIQRCFRQKSRFVFFLVIAQ